ncbi:MAG: LuxR C-terminal-related transcriptional regulator [Lachnospiraceae bacterium]|nr:LuxR C-terminal-related transcriptional regulator [Lachnospiraceae bacterium]
MKVMSTKEAAEKWNISQRRIQMLCQNGKIQGAIQLNHSWIIPCDSPRPADGRRKTSGSEPKRIDRTSLYFNPSYCNKKSASQLNPYDYQFCAIHNHFLRGDFQEATRLLKNFFHTCKDKDYYAPAYLLAIWISIDIATAEEKARVIALFQDFLEHNDYPYARLLVNNISDMPIQIRDSHPTETLPVELLPVFSYLLSKDALQNILNQRIGISPDMLLLFEVQVQMVDNYDNELVSASFHVLLAVFWMFMKDFDRCRYHQDIVAEIVIRNEWYTLIAEYFFALDWSFLKLEHAAAYERIMDLAQIILNNYYQSAFFPLPYSIKKQLTMEHVIVAQLIFHGYTNKEIADKMDISAYKVKKYINDLLDMTSTASKTELIEYLQQQTWHL